MTKKKRKEKRDRIMEIDLRFTELANLIEGEKRALTIDENEERSALLLEKDLLKLRLSSDGHSTLTQDEVSNERAFTQIVAAMHNKREVADEYRGLVNGVTMEIPQNRSATVQDGGSVASIIPLTIGDIIEPLEKGLILDKIGAKIQYGMDGAWQFPIVAGVEATLEDENIEVSDTTIDISKISPTPRRVAMSIPVSNRAIDQSSDLILAIVRKQLSLGLTRLLNRWMFSPESVNSKVSNGCFVAPKTVHEYTEIISNKQAIALKYAVIAWGVEMDGTGAFVCSAATYAQLKTTPRDPGSGLMIIEDERIDGSPVFITEYIGQNILGFGVFSYEMVAQFGKMRMTYDPYTGAKKNLVYFVFNTDFDMLSLRTEAFGTLKKTVVAEGA